MELYLIELMRQMYCEQCGKATVSLYMVGQLSPGEGHPIHRLRYRSGMRSFLSFLVVLAACDHSSSETPDAHIIVIDSAVDAPPVAPNTVTVRTYGPPAFIKYRDGSGAWQSAKQVDTGIYEIAITNDYEVVVVCGSSQGFDSSLFKRTFADGSRFTSFCFEDVQQPSWSPSPAR